MLLTFELHSKYYFEFGFAPDKEEHDVVLRGAGHVGNQQHPATAHSYDNGYKNLCC
jgi:hypothetical protein